MGIKQVKIAAGDITLGMYVSQLDRPWSQTPFPIQGLLIREPHEIKALRAYCQHVYIDITKGRGPITGNPVSIKTGLKGGSTPDFGKFPGQKQVSFEPTPIVVKRDVYPDSIPVSQESDKAERALLNLRGSFTLAVKQISKGKDFDYESLKANVGDMVDSVIRCPDAFTWLLRLRLKDSHSHDHSLRSALWAVQFGRYIGMPEGDIRILCLGTLLKDIGKLKLRNELIRKKKRNAKEEAEYEKFVEYGVEMLRESGKVEPRVISVVRYHCERFDGTGFPEGISGERIPLLARIAGIATTYDAISNPRECNDPVAASRAVSLLYNMRSRKFQEDLVVEFIQSVGLYPTGTLVELTTGDIGVVMEQHPKSRLTPQIAVMNINAANDDDKFVLVELRDEENSRKALAKAGSSLANSVAKLAIARDLEPSGFDIDFKQASGLIMECSYANILSEVVPAAAHKQEGSLLSSLRQRFQR